MDRDDFDGPLIEDIPEDAAILTRIEIVRMIDSEGNDTVRWACADGAGEDNVTLVEVLGLLEMTKDTAVREYMGDV